MNQSNCKIMSQLKITPFEKLGLIKNTDQAIKIRIQKIQNNLSKQKQRRIKTLIKAFKNQIIIADNIFLTIKQNKKYLYIIQPFYSNGLSRFETLRQFFEKSLDHKLKQRIFKNIFILVKKLHQLGQQHLALCPQNIWIEQQTKVYLAPYPIQLNTYYKKIGQKQSTQIPIMYLSPQIFFSIFFSQRHEKLQKEHQFQSDIWALGCIFAQLFISQTPILLSQTLNEQAVRYFELSGLNIQIEGLPKQILQQLKSITKLKLKNCLPLIEEMCQYCSNSEKNLLIGLLQIKNEKRLQLVMIEKIINQFQLDFTFQEQSRSQSFNYSIHKKQNRQTNIKDSTNKQQMKKKNLKNSFKSQSVFFNDQIDKNKEKPIDLESYNPILHQQNLSKRVTDVKKSIQGIQQDNKYLYAIKKFITKQNQFYSPNQYQNNKNFIMKISFLSLSNCYFEVLKSIRTLNKTIRLQIQKKSSIKSKIKDSCKITIQSNIRQWQKKHSTNKILIQFLDQFSEVLCKIQLDLSILFLFRNQKDRVWNKPLISWYTLSNQKQQKIGKIKVIFLQQIMSQVIFNDFQYFQSKNTNTNHMENQSQEIIQTSQFSQIQPKKRQSYKKKSYFHQNKQQYNLNININDCQSILSQINRCRY